MTKYIRTLYGYDGKARIFGEYCALCKRWIGASGQLGEELTVEEKARLWSYDICKPCTKQLRREGRYFGPTLLFLLMLAGLACVLVLAAIWYF